MWSNCNLVTIHFKSGLPDILRAVSCTGTFRRAMVARSGSLRISHFNRELLDIARVHLSTETATQVLFERLCCGHERKIYMMGGQDRMCIAGHFGSWTT